MDVVIVAPGATTRVPVLKCATALAENRRVGSVEILPADSDADIDNALVKVGDPATQTRLIVAGGDGILRAVLRRMVRRMVRRELARQAALARQGNEEPSDRRAGLAEDRTIADLAPVGLLPLEKTGELPDLARSQDLPDNPAQVASVVVDGSVRRLDLFRNDRGSLTLHGVLLGSAADGAGFDGAQIPGRMITWSARINVDDTILCEGGEPLLACAIANAAGYSRIGELTLVKEADPGGGAICAGVAVAVDGGIEVRRVSGRTVRVSPMPVPPIAPNSSEEDHFGVPFTDDGVDGILRHTCTWWVERGAWGLYMR